MRKIKNNKQIIAYALIAFHNWNNSSNREDRSLDTFEMFVEPLEMIHSGSDAIKYAKLLKKNEKTRKELNG